MLVIRGQILSFNDQPETTAESAYTHLEQGAMAISSDGKIQWIGEVANLPKTYQDWPLEDYGNQLVLPGFIDPHLHFPQYRMIAAFGKDLLDWLNRYTFIEEQRYDEQKFAAKAATFFLDELARNGTTSCLAFSTIHPQALDALFSEAKNRNMAIASGKTLMDINAPAGLQDTPQTAYDQTTDLIKKWHGKGRIKYAISPRFAVTSSQAQLEATGTLVKEHPKLLLQTHLSENTAEIEFVAKQFPWSKDYTDIYDKYGLLGENSLFAHGIHLSERELNRLSEAGSSIVHCPTSNNFLGSGHFKLHHTQSNERSVAVGLATDIGGGTSYSMLQTMRDAYTVSQLVGSRISAFESFYMATLGNARILKTDQEVGSFEIGKMADIVVLDPNATPILKARQALSQTLHDNLFSLLIMGDDRAVSETFIAGKKAKSIL